MICKLNFVHFKKNNLLYTGPEKPSLAFKATCVPLTGETSHSGRRRGWFIARPAPHPLTEAHGPIGASISLSPNSTYPHQAPTWTHTPAAQRRSSLAANQTEPNHAIASLMAFPLRSERCFGSGPGHAMSEHHPPAGASRGCAGARDNHISLEKASRSTAVAEKPSSRLRGQVLPLRTPLPSRPTGTKVAFLSGLASINY